jgi:hypothetical protein
MDQFVESETVSLGGRLVTSIKGVLVGILLFLASFPLLFWNEGRAVKTARGLSEGKGTVVAASADKVDTANEGKLVHLSGKAQSDQVLADPQLGVKLAALRLSRRVQIFQWIEEKETHTEKKLGGSEEKITTYTYKRAWDEQLRDSGQFREQAGHENPASKEYESQAWQADPVKVGAFTLPQTMLSRLTAHDRVPVTAEVLARLPMDLRTRAVLAGDELYIGKDPATPTIGDLKVAFLALKPCDVSLVAQQVRDTLQPFATKAGTALSMIEPGIVSAAQMFTHEEQSNTRLTWILRLVGFLLMAIGIGAVFGPLRTVADVVPLIGSILGMGIALFAFFVALPLTLVTISVAWIAYRPLLGVALLAGGVGVFVVAKLLRKSKRKAATA